MTAVTEFWALVQVEWFKIVHRRLNWIALGVTAALIVIVYALLWAAISVIEPSAPGEIPGAFPGGAPDALPGALPDAGLPDALPGADGADGAAEPGGLLSGEPLTEERLDEFRSLLFLEDSVPFALTMLYSFGLMAGIVVVGANVGAEYGWNTIRTTVSAYPMRGRLLLAKVVALSGALVSGLLIAMVISLVTSTVITLIDGEFTLSFVDWPFLRHSFFSFLRLLLQGAPYFAFTLLAAIWGTSTTSGISIAVGVLFLEGVVAALMTLAGGWVAEIPNYMLNRNADGLSQEVGGSFQADFEELAEFSAFESVLTFPDPVHSGIVLAVWTVVFAIGAWVVHQRQDLHFR